jgi:hypothetical protein
MGRAIEVEVAGEREVGKWYRMRGQKTSLVASIRNFFQA